MSHFCLYNKGMINVVSDYIFLKAIDLFRLAKTNLSDTLDEQKLDWKESGFFANKKQPRNAFQQLSERGQEA